MNKQLITFDQLAALSFFRFGKLDGVDMTLLIKGTRDIVEVELRDETDDYFIMTDGMIMLEKSYIQRFNKNVDRELFDGIPGSAIQKYLDNIDIVEFVLRKIKLLYPCCVSEDELGNNFSSLQMRIMKKLYQEGYIMKYLQDDPVYDDYQAVKLTKRGELYLFLVDNKIEIDKFRNLLDENGYNSVLVDSFLITQDLSREVNEILTLDNFITFFGEYDVNPYAEDVCKSSYGRVRVPRNK